MVVRGMSPTYTEYTIPYIAAYRGQGGRVVVRGVSLAYTAPAARTSRIIPPTYSHPA